MIIKVKICGITNLEDAVAAVDMGADLLGFNFYDKSPRYITPADAAEIIDQVPTFVDTVGVCVNPTDQQLRDMTEQVFLNWIQFHGDETPDFCNSLLWLNPRTIKAVRVKSNHDIETSQEFSTDALLFDAYHPEKYGGTGETFDWNIIDQMNRRVFIAGGINPENAVKAVELGFYGIDICSGIESEPGKKDHKKMKQLFKNIQHVRS